MNGHDHRYYALVADSINARAWEFLKKQSLKGTPRYEAYAFRESLCALDKSECDQNATPSAFHPRAQRNAFRRHDARLQSRSFARWNQSLRCSPGTE